MSIQTETALALKRPYNTRPEDLPPHSLIAAGVILGSMGAERSCEAHFAEDFSTGLAIDALKYVRARDAKREGRKEGDDAVAVIRVEDFDSSATTNAQELKRYSALCGWEYEGGNPDKKLVIVEAETDLVINPRPQSFMTQFLKEILNDPGRAKLAFFGRGRIRGLEQFAKRMAVGVSFGEDGEADYFDPRRRNVTSLETRPVAHMGRGETSVQVESTGAVGCSFYEPSS